VSVEVTRDVAGLAGEWDGLAERVRANPFVRSGWTAAWWQAFGRGSLEIVALRRDGQLAGVLPLRRIAGVIASPTNWHTPVFGPLVEDRAAAASLFDWLLARGPRHVALSFLDTEDLALAALADAAAAHDYRMAVRQRLRSPYLALGTGEGDADRKLTGKRRREIRRRRRLLEDQGELAFEVSAGADGRDELLEEGFRIEALGWKGARGTAIASRAQTRGFYDDVARWAAERGWLRLCFLRLNRRPLAFDLALEHEGHHYLLKTGYDPAYRAASPGVLLRHEAIARAARLGLQTYEFLGQAEATKLEWTDTCRERVLVQTFRRSPAGALDRVISTHGRRIAGQVRAALRR
jgi:CelD/BcsL family acetyltransferase involved in cellulose biosynthesis